MQCDSGGIAIRGWQVSIARRSVVPDREQPTIKIGRASAAGGCTMTWAQYTAVTPDRPPAAWHARYGAMLTYDDHVGAWGLLISL